MQFLNEVFQNKIQTHMALCEKVLAPKPNNWLGHP